MACSLHIAWGALSAPGGGPLGASPANGTCCTNNRIRETTVTTPSIQSLQDLFNSLNRAKRLLFELRLAALPQPWFIMLLERTGELSRTLEESILAEGKGPEEGAGMAPLFKLLAAMQGNVLADLRRMEGMVRYDDFPPTLAAMKDRLSDLSSRIRKELLENAPARVVEENAHAVTVAEESLSALRDGLQALEAETDLKMKEYCAALNDVFSMLERGGRTARVYARAAGSLRGIGRAKVAASGLFDQEFYRSQLPEEERGADDALQQYFAQKEPFVPFPGFDDEFYRASHPAVDQLRYNPLEHFARYGMLLRLDPGPAFDTRYYLRRNKDVLDANIQPIKHFLHHGRREGRSASPSAEEARRRTATDAGPRPGEDQPRTPDGRPSISAVHPLTGGPAGVAEFLDALNRQDMKHPFEVVLVEASASGSEIEAVERWLANNRERGGLHPSMAVRILRKTDRTEAVSAREKGVGAARADVVFIADHGVLPAPACLGEHLRAHRFGDCHAAVGLARDESAPGQDRTTSCSAEDLGVRPLPHGILNDAPGTFSFLKDAVEGGWFDASLGCEESRGLAAKLYSNGRNARFLDEAASAFSNEGIPRGGEAPLAPLAGWNALLDGYPDLALVDRPRYQMRAARLLDAAADQADSPAYRAARDRLKAPGRTHVSIRKSRPLRILTYKWHASHQYELFKAPHAFTLATHIGTAHCNQWDYGTRPRPQNIEFAPLESINPDEYDFAILPFDEHVLNPDHCAALSPDWGQAFLTMLELTKGMPRAAICHGTPQIQERDDPASGSVFGDMLPHSREALRALLEDVHVVCNSHQAEQEWAFHKSSVIWHGFSPEEFPAGRHAGDCLTLSRNAYEQRPNYRGETFRQGVETILNGRCTIEYTAAPPIHAGYAQNSQEWAVARFQNYARYIGDFAMYFNPTVYSPMPRSRDEAMLTGTIPVTLRNHDADMFIRNGHNGFHGDSAEELAEHMLWLKRNERQRREIGRNARLTAMDVFNIDRYLSGWAELIRRLR